MERVFKGDSDIAVYVVIEATLGVQEKINQHNDIVGSSCGSKKVTV
jgi:hypothetical protein